MKKIDPYKQKRMGRRLALIAVVPGSAAQAVLHHGRFTAHMATSRRVEARVRPNAAKWVHGRAPAKDPVGEVFNVQAPMRNAMFALLGTGTARRFGSLPPV